MKMFATRLRPNQDLKLELEKIVKNQGITSGFIGTCVGSLHSAKLRMAGAEPDKQDVRTYEGHFEIVSLVGTISTNGTHLHMSISDSEGKVVGGHLKEGATIATTVEVVICYDEKITFNRVIDEDTGFEELEVEG